MTVDAVAAQLAETAALVAHARASIGENHPIDVATLAQRVDAACKAINALPPGQAKPLAPKLMAIYDDLGVLVEAVKREHAALKQAMGALDARRRAQSAYGGARRS